MSNSALRHWAALSLTITVHLLFLIPLVMSFNWTIKPTKKEPIVVSLLRAEIKQPIEKKPEQSVNKPIELDTQIAPVPREIEEKQVVPAPKENMPKPEPLKPKDPPKPDLNDRLKELLTSRLNSSIDAELNQLEEQVAQSQREKTARERAQLEWKEQISSLVRSNVIRPVGLSEDPEVVYEIRLLDDGSMLGEPRLIKSSGHDLVDLMVERAIRKSSPFPVPQNPDVFERTIVLTFRPLQD